jgi:hypothetical protein
VRRSNDLLICHAAVERERGNLARYFSPNVVGRAGLKDHNLIKGLAIGAGEFGALNLDQFLCRAPHLPHPCASFRITSE